jgi:hypothetical protein
MTTYFVDGHELYGSITAGEDHQFREDPALWRYWSVNMLSFKILTWQGIVAALNQGNRSVMF